MSEKGARAADLKKVFKTLHDAEIPFGIESESSDGSITAWVDCGDRIEIVTFFGRIKADDQPVWQAGDIASWLIKTSAAEPRTHVTPRRRRRDASTER
jgi:hypothetical protein